MLSLESLAQRYRLAQNRWRFARALPDIFRTPQSSLGHDRFVLLSMVHHRDVGPYLLAVKSLPSFPVTVPNSCSYGPDDNARRQICTL